MTFYMEPVNKKLKNFHIHLLNFLIRFDLPVEHKEHDTREPTIPNRMSTVRCILDRPWCKAEQNCMNRKDQISNFNCLPFDFFLRLCTAQLCEASELRNILQERYERKDYRKLWDFKCLSFNLLVGIVVISTVVVVGGNGVTSTTPKVTVASTPPFEPSFRSS